MNKRGRGRPKITVDAKITRSIRIKPSVKAMIEREHGKIQSWFDKKISEEFGNEVVVVFKSKKGEAIANESEDTFDASEADF